MKIFGTAYGGGHAKAVIPVLRELRDRGHETIFLAPTLAAPIAKAERMPVRGYLDYLHVVSETDVSRLGRTLASSMHAPGTGIEFEESVAYLGTNWSEALQRFGEADAEALFDRVGRHAFLPVSFMSRVFEEERPDVILATKSPKTERASLVAAERLGIPSVMLQNVFDSMRPEIRRRAGEELFDRTLGRFVSNPTAICVCSQPDADEIATAAESFGLALDGTRVVVTGQPEIDTIQTLYEDGTPHFFGAGAGTTVIAWAHGSGIPDTPQVMEMIAGWLQQFPSDHFLLVVKAHPNSSAQDLAELRSWSEDLPVRVRLITDEFSGEEMVVNAHLVLSQSSTLLLGAICVDRAIVVLDPSCTRSGEIYLARGLAFPARNQEQLGRAVEAAIDGSSPRAQEIAARCEAVGIPVNAASRIADVVLESASGGS